MTTDILPTFDTLPVELLHRVFDNLDTETILLSLQYVCKRLYLITKNYNRYTLNFKAIFKQKFHRICRNIHPENIISFILSDEYQTPGQIELFLSLYRIERFNHLQSITLLSIEESSLKIILENLLINSYLVSLIIHYESYSKLNSDTIQLISKILKKNILRKVDFNLGYEIIDQLEWPNECSIEYLKLSDSIQFDTFCTILRCSSQLKTFIFQDCIIDNNDKFHSIISDMIIYPQLTSLTLEDCELNMDMIEAFLSLTPSLESFTIKSNTSDLIDGQRWERLIQIKLPYLKKFQFAFQRNIGTNCEVADFHSYIKSFQTEFWLETKKWFINAVGIKKSVYLNLYSLPDCVPKINFHSKANKISYTNVPISYKNLLIMENVRELVLDLMDIQTDMIEQDKNSIERLFTKLTKLTLRLDGDWPNSSLELLSLLIDLSTITELELSINFNAGNLENITTGIACLLEKAIHIRSIIIFTRTVSVKTICSIVSNRIKHLKVPVKTIEDMQVILKQLTHLSSITFNLPFDSSVTISEIIEWIVEQGRDFTYKSTRFSLSLWLS